MQHQTNDAPTAKTWNVLLIPDTESGGYTAKVPSLPGCVSEGDTLEEALANIKEAIELYLESLQADNEPIPTDNTKIETVAVAV